MYWSTVNTVMWSQLDYVTLVCVGRAYVCGQCNLMCVGWGADTCLVAVTLDMQ